MWNIILRAIVSLAGGFGTISIIAKKLAEQYQWYISRGYQTSTAPMTVWEIIGQSLLVALIAFFVLSVAAYARKLSNPIAVSEEETSTETIV